MMRGLLGHVFKFLPSGLPLISKVLLDAKSLVEGDVETAKAKFLELHAQIETLCDDTSASGATEQKILSCLRQYAVVFSVLDDNGIKSQSRRINHIIQGWLYQNATSLLGVDAGSEVKSANPKVRGIALAAMGGSQSDLVYIPRKHRRVISRANYINEVVALRKDLKACLDF